jgi:hypothetical protein
MVTVTNLPSRPAPVLARTLTSLSALFGGRVILGIGAGRVTPEPLAATRGEDGRWIGGSVPQWVDELTAAVLDHDAAGFIYRSPDDTPADEALARWATEIVPAVREAITPT